MFANLQDAAMGQANLERCILWGTNLNSAHLQWAKLSCARLAGAHIDYETDLANVDWGNDYILGEELAGEYEAAEAVYRMLKEWHRQHGYYSIASEFAYRENVVHTKALGLQARQEWGEAKKSFRVALESLRKRLART